MILMDQTRLDIYFPVPQWVFNDSQIAMVMEVLGEAIVTEGETPSGAVVPNADGANLLRLGLTTSNKYPRGFLLDQDLRTDPAADDLEFELYFIPEEDLDDDNDSVADEEDNRPFTVNLGQLNNDADAQGDLCDDDDDNDGKLDEEDDCSKGEIGSPMKRAITITMVVKIIATRIQTMTMIPFRIVLITVSLWVIQSRKCRFRSMG